MTGLARPWDVDRYEPPLHAVSTGPKDRSLPTLIVDNDINGLGKYYGTKRVRQSETGDGAATKPGIIISSLNGKSRHLYFLAAPILDDAAGEIIAAVETLQDM